MCMAWADDHHSAGTGIDTGREESGRRGPWNDLGIADAGVRCNRCVSLVGAFSGVSLPAISSKLTFAFV
jgi:hypothetical protein